MNTIISPSLHQKLQTKDGTLSLLSISTFTSLVFVTLALLLSPLSAGAQAHHEPAQVYAQSRTYQYPISHPPEIVTPYSPGEHNWNSGHRGVDLAADLGETIYAAASGDVIYAGILNDRPVVSIEDENGIRTTYEPVAPSVTKGQSITKGSPIGVIDGYHCAIATACLHWGAKRGASDYINPLWLVNPPIVRLLE